MKVRLPFLGVGTGRCGTNSLTRIVRACKNAVVTHEGYSLDWYDPGCSEVGRLIKDFKDRQNRGKLAGDVAQSILPHIPAIRSAFPRCPVICLHRPKADTVASFMNFGSAMIRPYDKLDWQDKSMGETNRRRAIKCFPVIDAVNRSQAFGFYWEMYEEWMRQKISQPVMHVEMDDLNNDETLVRIFDFLGIPESDRVFLDKRKHWTKEEVAKQRTQYALLTDIEV